MMAAANDGETIFQTLPVHISVYWEKFRREIDFSEVSAIQMCSTVGFVLLEIVTGEKYNITWAIFGTFGLQGFALYGNIND